MKPRTGSSAVAVSLLRSFPGRRLGFHLPGFLAFQARGIFSSSCAASSVFSFFGGFRLSLVIWPSSCGEGVAAWVLRQAASKVAARRQTLGGQNPSTAIAARRDPTALRRHQAEPDLANAFLAISARQP